METVELKKIWNTLAKKQLIDQELAKENILEIITKEGNGIINRMKRKINSDYYVVLFGVIFTPLAILFAVYWNNTHPDLHDAAQLGRVYTILALMEAYLVFGLIKVVRNRKFLDTTFNIGTLKESMEKALSYLKAELKKAKIAGLVFMYSILSFVLIDIFLGIEGFGNLNFSTTGPNIFSSYFAVFVILIMFALPSIVKFETKRYTQAIQDIGRTLLDLKEED
jgi:hypothetical protein